MRRQLPVVKAGCATLYAGDIVAAGRTLDKHSPTQNKVLHKVYSNTRVLVQRDCFILPALLQPQTYDVVHTVIKGFASSYRADSPNLKEHTGIVLEFDWATGRLSVHCVTNNSKEIESDDFAYPIFGLCIKQKANYHGKHIMVDAVIEHRLYWPWFREDGGILLIGSDFDGSRRFPTENVMNISEQNTKRLQIEAEDALIKEQQQRAKDKERSGFIPF